VAELTPDKHDFVITYVVEEGPRYKFGDITVESEIHDLKPEGFQPLIPNQKGDWYNAKSVEDTVDNMTKQAGVFGYAFADVNPIFKHDAETKTVGIIYKINETPRVYVERIDVNGNTLTQDKVVRREFRLAEGDAFNSFQVKRSSDRIQSLGYFQEKLEIEQKKGSAEDRIILQANVEEKATGQLQLSAGYSSLEKLIFSASIAQNNFRGAGQTLRLSGSISTYSKSVELGFTEPYLFNKNVALGVDLFRRDYNSFNYVGNSRNTTYSQASTGFQARLTNRLITSVASARHCSPGATSAMPLAAGHSRRSGIAWCAIRSTIVNGRTTARVSSSGRIWPVQAAACNICAPR
jgi:outer membrane protein insertion porin family